MNIETAERLVALTLRMSGELHDAVRDIQNTEPGEEFNRLRGAVGRVMGEIYFEILKPAFEEHPSLKPDGWNEP